MSRAAASSCLVGPTATGKTALALELAEALGAEIVSADSRQVYRGLDVGTAKPTPAERARVPHHCLDLVDPDEAFDAARFRAAAPRALADVARAAGTRSWSAGRGSSVRVLLRGLCPAPPRAPAVRAALRALAARAGSRELHRHLARARSRRRRRASTRATRCASCARSRWRSRAAGGCRTGRRRTASPRRRTTPCVVGLAVAAAGARRAHRGARAPRWSRPGSPTRSGALRARGLADDGAGVGERRLSRDARASSTAPAISTAALAALVLATRRFAKRQRTWFRAEPGVVWRDPARTASGCCARSMAFLAHGARPAP